MGFYEAILNFKERLTSQPFLNFKEERHYEILQDILNFKERLTSQTSLWVPQIKNVLYYMYLCLKFKASANTHTCTHSPQYKCAHATVALWKCFWTKWRGGKGDEREIEGGWSDKGDEKRREWMRWRRGGDEVYVDRDEGVEETEIGR